jgi:hypothetical protein
VIDIGSQPVDRRVVWVVSGIALAIAGCCRSGPNHKCDFTSPTQTSDGGTDGPVLCGTEVCEDGRVCCVTKVPLSASCIVPEDFERLRCEKMDLPCLTPADCPSGLTCCLSIAGETGTVSCRPQLLCLSEGSYVACGSDADCPINQPTCNQVSMAPNGEPFRVCGFVPPP